MSKFGLSCVWWRVATFGVTLLVGCGGGGGSGPTTPPPEPPRPVTFSIQVTDAPVASTLRVEQKAEASINWRFTSTAENPTAASYVVSSTTEGVQITGGSGNALPNTSLSTELGYECAAIGAVDAQLTINVGTATKNVSWSINCTGQRIIAEPVEQSTTSIRLDAGAALVWRYESIGEDAQELAYAIESSVESIRIDPASGSSLPNTDINTTLSYVCIAVGNVTLDLSITVGTATHSQSWEVLCTDETVVVESPPARMSVSVGETADGELAWRYSSTSDEPRRISYSVRSSLEGVLVSNATGQVLPDSSVTHILEYSCTTQGLVEIDVMIDVGSASHELAWVVECTGEVIEIQTPLLLTSVSVGESATSELRWLFRSSGESPRQFDYFVRSSNTDVQIFDGQGSASPDTALSTQFAYLCQNSGDVRADITFVVGSATKAITWMLECTEETVLINSEPMKTSVSAGKRAEAEFEWQVQTSGNQNRLFAYTVSSADQALLIDDAAGTVAPGQTVATKLAFACENQAQVLFALTVAVGNASEPVSWNVECTEESIEITSVVPSSTTVSINETASFELQWLFRTTGNENREFEYVVRSATDHVQIANATGTATPNSGISTTFKYTCQHAGAVTAEIMVDVGNATHPLTWPIICTQESVATVTVPPFVSVSAGDVAHAVFQWQMQTTGDPLREFTYRITTQTQSLDIQDASGRVKPDETVSTSLAFQCGETAQSHAIELNIETGSAQQRLIWELECTAETVEFTLERLQPVVVPLLERASTQMLWTLNSTARVSREFDYVVSTTTPNLRISSAKGTVNAGTSVTNDLEYACLREEQVSVTVRVQVGRTQADITWEVTCARDSIVVIAAPPSRTVLLGDSAVAELVWEFRSSHPNREATFVVSSSTRGLQIRNGEGTAFAGSPIETTLRYACSSRRRVAVELQINVSNLNRTVPWQVECAGEDLTRFTAKFYQGPRIATVEFEENQGTWSGRVTKSRNPAEEPTPRFRTNRQLFIELHTQHNEREPLPLTVRFNNTNRSYDATQVGEVTTRDSSSDTNDHYESRFVFDVAASAFSSFGELAVIIDPESIFPEVDESNNRVNFTLDVGNSVSLPYLQLTLIPIQTRQGLPDVSDVERFTQPIYELMPVGIIDISVGDTFDLSAQSWSLASGGSFLQRLYGLYIREGDRSTFYHGVVLQRGKTTLCGIAYVDANVAITVDQSENCQPSTVAHEIGHNFSLEHAPACGAGEQGPDPDFPYPEGNIGSETGWLMQQRIYIEPTAPVFIGFNHRYFDVMSYCPETFTSRYSYRKALDKLYDRFGVRAASKVGTPVASEIERMDGRSIAIVGHVSLDTGWQVSEVAVVEREPHYFAPGATEYVLYVTHIASGTVLHREGFRTLKQVHGTDDRLSWGVRIPYFNSEGLQVSVVDSGNQVVLNQDLSLETR